MTALDEAIAARDELHLSDAWKLYGGKPTTHTALCGKHLDACIAALQPTPPPPPPSAPPVPASSAYPNAFGPFGEHAPDWGDPSKWRSDSATLLATVKANAAAGVLAVAGYGIAYYEARATDPQVTVTNTRGWGTAPGTRTFRCPTGATPAAGSDAHMVVKQPDGTYLEMWQAARVAGGWTAGAVCVAQPGEFTYPIAGCRGASTTLMSGVVVPDDIASGVCAHALAATLPSAAVSKAHVYPSNSSDGTNTAGIPEGARLVLDPAVDLSGLDTVNRILAKAAQVYGMILIDKTGSGLEIDGLDPLSFTSIGHPDGWAAVGVSGYPSLNGLAALVPKMRIASS